MLTGRNCQQLLRWEKCVLDATHAYQTCTRPNSETKRSISKLCFVIASPFVWQLQLYIKALGPISCSSLYGLKCEVSPNMMSMQRFDFNKRPLFQESQQTDRDQNRWKKHRSLSVSAAIPVEFNSINLIHLTWTESSVFKLLGFIKRMLHFLWPVFHQTQWSATKIY